MFRFFFLAILIVCIKAQGTDKNYMNYHRSINAAQYLFLKGNSDSSIKLYKKVFSAFDFIFPRDCLDAAQFAYFANHKEEAICFLVKGFENGVTPFHLQSLPLFEFSFTKHDSFYNALMKHYQVSRSIYLKKINIDALIEATNIYWIDQSTKNNRDSNSEKNGNLYLKGVTGSNVRRIDSIMKKYEFPREQLIGIGGSTMFKELGITSQKDLLTLFEENKNKLKMFVEQFNDINSLNFINAEYMLISLYHHPCPVGTLGNENLLKAVKTGYLHPRDYAFLIERDLHRGACGYRYENLPEKVKLQICPPSFPADYVSPMQYPVPKTLDTVKINKARFEIGMCSLEVDSLKTDFEKKFNVKLYYGMMNTK